MLILVRHGRTAANAAGVLQGRLDLSLDEVGRAQAEAVASSIGTVDRVICSPLQRARETAAFLSSTVEVDERWSELDYGSYDGMLLADVPPDTWTRWATDLDFATPLGESMGSLDVRVRAAAAELLAVSVDADVVVVSHVSPIKAAVAWSLGCDISVSFRCHLDQASVCRIAAGPRGPVLHSFNEVYYTR